MNIAFYIPPHIPTDVVFGGVANIANIAAAINRHTDSSAYLLRDSTQSRLSWITGVPQVALPGTAGSRSILSADVVVIPEVCALHVRRFMGGEWATSKRVLYAQAFSPEYIKPSMAGYHSYDPMGFTDFWAPSKVVAKTVKNHTKSDITIIPNCISDEWLDVVTKTLKTTTRDPRKILFVDRKGQNIFNDVIIYNLKKRYSDLTYSRIATVSWREVIHEMCTSRAVIINFPAEGFNRMALEAILCGCLPIGYHGEGGLSFLKNGYNCLLNNTHNNGKQTLEYIDNLLSGKHFLENSCSPPLQSRVNIPYKECDIAKLVIEALK
jgi:hypothetical protein